MIWRLDTCVHVLLTVSDEKWVHQKYFCEAKYCGYLKEKHLNNCLRYMLNMPLFPWNIILLERMLNYFLSDLDMWQIFSQKMNEVSLFF